MQFIRKGEVFLPVLFFVFSWWLMDKSFGYNPVTHQFRIARHQIGDFGLHLSLIRSFSWGKNIPPELPFYPGRPLPYHYGLDLVVGLLEKTGIRIDVAFNGISAVAFTILLFFIYKLPQIIFGKNIYIGLLTVVLFIFHSNLTFLDFFKNRALSRSMLRELWMLPDYINKGPFDGSIISLFFTLNVFLNQRHLIVALAMSLGIFVYIFPYLMKKKVLAVRPLLVIGVILGAISWFHTLVFVSDLVVLGAILFLFGRSRWMIHIFASALLLAVPRFVDIVRFRDPGRSFGLFNPGFLAPRPLTPTGFISYWWVNLGITLFLVPLGVILAPSKSRKVFLAFLPLFLIANLFQLSYRMDHNHTLFNLFLIVANGYIAFFLVYLWKRGLWLKVIVGILVFFLIISGGIDMMALKNDFQYTFPDAPTNQLMEWIRKTTDPHAVFLSREDILDPVTISGRKNYFGATYYGEVMGYPISARRQLAKKFFEARNQETFTEAKTAGIDYIVLPQHPPSNFRYEVDRALFEKNLKTVYKDSDATVYQL